MHIYNFLDEMSELNGKLEETAARLHDETERRKIEDFQKKYSLLDYQLRNQVRLISVAMMDTDIEIQ